MTDAASNPTVPGDNADLAVIVLAAGQGTRFRSDLAKVLHRAAGRSLVGHVLEAVRPLDAGQVIVVVGHQADQVRAEVDAADLPGLTTVVQSEQRGTGHAVQQAVPALGDGIERVMVLPGDTPLLGRATLAGLVAAAAGRSGAMLTAELDDPTGYGRVLRDGDGVVTGIVEQRDATPEQLEVREINAGMYLVQRTPLVDALGRLDDDNAQGELYLTDIVGMLAGDGHAIVPVVVAEDEVAGVNDRGQLAAAAAVLRDRHLGHLMVEVGVSVTDPVTTHVDVDVQVGRDAVLLPGTILEAGTRLGERTKAGAFVETKNASFAPGAKAGHLAYVGDATIGASVNVGCGVVVVNYDGEAKHHTIVEDGAFVGSGTMLVAPVTVGHGAYVAAGSTITDDVPADALAIARSRQTTKDGWAARRREQG